MATGQVKTLKDIRLGTLSFAMPALSVCNSEAIFFAGEQAQE